MKLPKGYIVNGVNCGIKKDKNDLGIIVSTYPAHCSAAFTTNLLKTDSIKVSQQHLNKTDSIKVILVNSGCANTASGPQGYKITLDICSYLAKKFNVKKEQTLIASTGVIGVPLPKEKIFSGIDKLHSIVESGKVDCMNFEKAIMTTDTVPKIVWQVANIEGKKVSLICFAKGAGMIGPQLRVYPPHATMLVFFLSDVNISKKISEKILKEKILPHFNSFSIDADMSPNDTIFFCCNSSANNKKISSTNKSFEIFAEMAESVSKKIVQKLLFDGEGVTKVSKIIVKSSSDKVARRIFDTVSSSLLVKTAIYGADPNWGRILSACGRSGVEINIDKVNIFIGPYQVVKNGQNNFIKDNIVRRIMLKKFYEITIATGDRKSKDYIFYTTDLSKKYVDINSKYKT